MVLTVNGAVTPLISPEQCRAARAFLDINQSRLAERSNLTIRSIQLFERGLRKPRASTLLALRTALQEEGVAFIDGQWPGVRRAKTKSPEDL